MSTGFQEYNRIFPAKCSGCEVLPECLAEPVVDFERDCVDILFQYRCPKCEKSSYCVGRQEGAVDSLKMATWLWDILQREGPVAQSRAFWGWPRQGDNLDGDQDLTSL